MNENELLDQTEAETIEQLRAPLASHQTVCERVFNTISLTIHTTLEVMPEKSISKIPMSRRVALNLMVRLWNDLRCVGLLAARGYPLQAASLVIRGRALHRLHWS